MKKVIGIAIATLLLVCVALTGVSLAGSAKLPLYPVIGGPPPSGGLPDTSAEPQGFAIINWPDSTSSQIEVLLVVQVKGLAANTEYQVKTAGKVLGTFWTNALGGKNEGKGNGSFQAKYTIDNPHPGQALEPGKHVNIRLMDGTPVLATDVI